MLAPTRARVVLSRAALVDGEPAPAAGDVLVTGPSSPWTGAAPAVRVERVDGRMVRYVRVNVERGLLGGERWVFLPPARWRGPERLTRRRSR